MARLLFICLVCLSPLCLSVQAADNSALKNSRFIQLIKQIKNIQLSLPDSEAGDTKIAVSPLSAAPEELDVGIPEGEELLLAIHVGKYFLADVFAYKSQANAMIGLGNLFEVLDFPIIIDLGKSTASGWFMNEANTFELNFSEQQIAKAKVNGQEFILNKENYRVEEDDLYVDADVINTWFGTRMAFDFSALSVKLSSSSPLPIEQRLARENKAIYSQQRSTPVLPWKENQYRAFSTPVFDVQLNSRVTEENTFYGYSALGSHDLAYLNSQYFIGGIKDDNISDLRWRLSKESADGGLLGPLNLSSYEFGDINPIRSGIDYNANISRGFALSSRALGQVNDNKININGDIQPGWDVELYRNGILIDKQLSLQDGRYEFNDVDLIFGQNTFEMILYGPQGQVEKSIREVLVSQNSVKRDDSSFAMSLTQTGKSLFGITQGSAGDNEGWLFAGSYEQGVTDWFSVSLGQSTLFSREGSNKLNYNIGANLTLFERLLIDSDFSFDNNDNQSMQLSAKTGFGKHSFDYRYRIDKSGNGGDRTEHLLRMSGQAFRGLALPLNYQNQYDFIETANGQKIQNLTNQISVNVGKTSIANDIFWQDTDNVTGTDSYSLAGSSRIQRSFGKYFTRFEMDYTLEPKAEITRVNSKMSWAMTSDLQSEVALNYNTVDDKYQSEWKLNWRHENFNLSGNLDYDQGGDWALGLFFRFSLGYETDKNNYFLSNKPLTSSGALKVRVFEDLNANGQFDVGEPLIKGAKIKGAQNYRQAVSDEQGIALLQNMPNNVTTDIELKEGSLGDPFLIPGFEGVSITPRRGFVDRLDFPVVTSSEVEGTVYLRNKEGEETPAPYVTVNLLDEQGHIVASEDTAFDGYYLFTDLRPGNYRASIDSDYLERKKLHKTDDLILDLSAQGDILNGSDFTLEQLEFTSGYVVSVGSFSSLNILKTYWYLLQKRYRRRLNQPAFFLYDEGNGKYQLNLAFYQENEQAIKACEEISKLDINCSVEAYEFSF
ncbi:hypothetical protein [Thalassomonas actiniarum]|uniref:Sporulation protein n=1 Tax=Thalassomonas actiniarum TaxID=485447 RepID=A0AAE9YQC0_9GAMM|nr:hypothetical protein [Thalassomonas actiniarum]WDD99260.1 sporulation protein [Thalassomonas actiniarum]